MRMHEKQTDKVIIDATGSIHGDRHEDDWVRLIRVELTIMSDLYSDRIFQRTVRLRSSSGGHSV